MSKLGDPFSNGGRCERCNEPESENRLQEDLANTRALLKVANEECASLRTRLAEWLRAP